MATVRQPEASATTRREGIGTALLTTVVVLLADLPVLAIAVFPLLEEHGGPNYSYAGEYSWLLSVSFLYLAGALALGLHWQRRYQRTARLVGIGLGVLPVLALAWAVAARWYLGGTFAYNGPF